MVVAIVVLGTCVFFGWLGGKRFGCRSERGWVYGAAGLGGLGRLHEPFRSGARSIHVDPMMIEWLCCCDPIVVLHVR